MLNDYIWTGVYIIPLNLISFTDIFSCVREALKKNKYEVLIDAYLQRLKVKCVENEAWFRKQSEEFNNFRLTFVKTQP